MFADVSLGLPEDGLEELRAATARSAVHALRSSTQSMQASSKYSMSSAQLFDYLAESGWMDYLHGAARADNVEAAEPLPAIVLELEGDENGSEDLTKETRYAVKHEHGDVVVQAEA